MSRGGLPNKPNVASLHYFCTRFRVPCLTTILDSRSLEFENTYTEGGTSFLFATSFDVFAHRFQISSSVGSRFLFSSMTDNGTACVSLCLAPCCILDTSLFLWPNNVVPSLLHPSSFHDQFSHHILVVVCPRFACLSSQHSLEWANRASRYPQHIQSSLGETPQSTQPSVVHFATFLPCQDKSFME